MADEYFKGRARHMTEERKQQIRDKLAKRNSSVHEPFIPTWAKGMGILAAVLGVFLSLAVLVAAVLGVVWLAGEVL